MKKVAIVQSNYIPWKGYFDMIASVDEFIIYDDMQFTRRDWRNRNLIKTPQGLHWLTVPVKVKGKYHQSIRETEIEGTDWVETHLKSLMANYARAPHFAEIFALVEPAYRSEHTKLTDLNRDLIERICAFLGITARLTNSRDYALVDGKSERLAELCRQAGAQAYISGPAAREYLDETEFFKLGIEVQWFEYANYPAYPQLWGEFAHGVSILDLLFNCGVESPRFMKYVKAPVETTEHGNP